MKKLIIALGFFCLANTGQSQNSLDSLLGTLHNKDLYVAPIIRGVYIGIRKEKTDRDPERPYYMVSSLDEDIRETEKKYSSKILIEKLFALLQDPQRDFYANALLYDLLENKKLGKLLFMKRDEWINSGRKINDTQHWTEYMQKNIYTY